MSVPNTFFGTIFFILQNYGGSLLRGAGTTLLIAVVSTLEGVIIGLVVGYGLAIVGMRILPIWWTCLAISVPAVSIAAIMFALKVKETKGVDLDSIE